MMIHHVFVRCGLKYTPFIATISKNRYNTTETLMKKISSVIQIIRIKNLVLINTKFLRYSLRSQRVTPRTCDVTDKVKEQFNEFTIVPVNQAHSSTNLRSSQRSRRATSIPESIIYDSLQRRKTIHYFPKMTFTVFDARKYDYLLSLDFDIYDLRNENDGEPIFNERDGEPMYLRDDDEPISPEDNENQNVTIYFNKTHPVTYLTIPISQNIM